MKKPILINVMIDYSVYFKCERIVKRLHSLGVDLSVDDFVNDVLFAFNENKFFEDVFERQFQKMFERS